MFLLTRCLEIHREMLNRVLREKLINPECAFIARADIGLRYLLQEIGATINFSEIERRVSARLPVKR